MLVVGLTGGIGSGKSAASAHFEKLGRPVVDADIVAREVVEPGETALDKISEKFGEDVLDSRGQLNRAELRKIVFEEPSLREWLEQLLHPIIRNRIMDKLEALQELTPFAILSSPLLLETDQHKLVDHVVVVDCPEALQIERTTKRDTTDAEQVKRIMAAQLPREERLSQADSVLDNSGSVSDLEQQVKALDTKILALVTAQ